MSSQILTDELLRPGRHAESDAASVIGVWTTASRHTDGLAADSVPGGYLGRFPCLGVPHSGFSTQS